MARLGDVFPLVRNGASIKQTDGAAGIPITRIETISNREIDRNKFGYADIIDDSKYKDYILQDGDILMSHINSEKHLGKVALYKKQGNEQIIHGMNLLMLRANPSVLFPPFAIYFFETSAFLLQIKKITKKSVNQASFTVKSLKEVEIPLPPIDEQRKIAAVLDKVSDLIAKRKQQLDKLDELVKSRFIEMFGDPMTNPYNLPKVILGSVLTIEPQNGLYKPQSDYVSDGTGVPILRIDSFYEGKVSNLSSLKRLICSEIELKRYSLYENDIVINRVNSIEYLGKCGLIQGLVENTIFESNMMRLHVDEHKFHPVYITKLLCSEFIYQQILRRAKKAVNQASINQKDVQSFVVYMPPIEQQDQFAAFVKQTDKSKLAIQKSLEKLEILKKALMQKYFG